MTPTIAPRVLLAEVRRLTIPALTVRDLVTMGLLAIAYFLSARIGLAFALVGGNASPIWPPAGIAFGVLFIGGLRLWPGILLGALLADLSNGSAPIGSVLAAAGATCEAATAVILLGRTSFRPQLDRLGDVPVFTIRGCALPAAVGAATGVASLAVTGAFGTDDLALAWVAWWAGDALSLLILGSLLITWLTRPEFDVLRVRPVESLIALGTVALVSWVLFFDVFDLRASGQSVAFPIIPAVIWVAFRTGPRGNAAAGVIFSLIAIVATGRGLGPFVGTTVEGTFFYLAVFIALVGVTGNAVAAVVAEREAGWTALEAAGERASRELTRLRAVESIGRLLAEQGPTEATLGGVVDVLADVFGYSHPSIYTGDDLTVRLGAQRGYSEPLAEVGSGQGVMGRAMRTRETQYLPDATLDPTYRSADDTIRSEVAVPLVSHDAFLGVLNVESRERLDERDLAAIAVVGDRVAAAMALAMERSALADLAVRDALTGLHNRRYLDEALARLAAEQTRLPGPERRRLAVIMFDLDHFGALNRLHGHQVGDDVLRTFAAIIAARFRGSDLLARYGGEEFVAILPGARIEDGVRAAEEVRLRFAAAELVGVDGGTMAMTVSAGCAEGDGVDPSLWELIGVADVGLRMAKRAGRDLVVAA